MPEQLIFSLEGQPSFSLTDFVATKANAEARHMLEADHWEGKRLILQGPKASGKSHLAHIWAEAHHATILTSEEVSSWSPKAFPTHLVVDDVTGDIAQEPLFHLLNYQYEQNFRVLLTMRDLPQRLSLDLQDLRSRLEGSSIAMLKNPQDEDLSVVMLKHFSDRQLQISPENISFLIKRMERSYEMAAMIVAQIDQLSLRDKRPITQEVIRRALDGLSDQKAAHAQEFKV